MGGSQQDLILKSGQRIKTCQKYKYLGVNITNDGTLDDAITDGHIQGRRAASMLNNSLFDQKITKNSKRLKSIDTHRKSKENLGSDKNGFLEAFGKKIETGENTGN